MADFTFNDLENDDDILFEAMLRQAVIKVQMKEMAALPSDEELRETYTFSERHNRRMKKIFAAERRREIFVSVRRWSKVAAAIICVTATVLFGILLTSSEVRAAVRNVFVRFYDGFARIEFIEPELPICSAPIDSPAEINRVATEFTLGFIPEGYELIDSEVLGDGIFNVFMDADGNLLIWDINTTDAAVAVDTDNTDYRTEAHEGIEYHIFESRSEGYLSTVVWTQDGFVFNLTGLLDIDELMRIAFSVE
jgi:hypothetical protein